MFTYLWEYWVKAEHLEEFLEYYGPGGKWVELFRKGKGFVSTDLHQDVTNPYRFVTVDLWESKSDRDTFRVLFKHEFKTIDDHCENFTVKENFLGDFEATRAGKVDLG